MNNYRESEPAPENDSCTPSNPPVKQRALVIGINQYKTSLSTLSNAVNDARAVAEILTNDYGFIVNYLPDGQANLVDIQNAITDALNDGPDVRWFFYFAGHGTVISETGYLLPANAEKGRAESMISLPDLLRACIKSTCDEVLIVLDACYSGRGFVRFDSLDLPAPDPVEHRVRQIITSGNPTEPVLDAGADNHSIFTQALLEVLRGWTGAHNDKGQILFSKLRDELAYQIPARLRAQSRAALLQQPLGGNFQSNSKGCEFIFSPLSHIRRLPSENVNDLRSGDSERRQAGLQHLVKISNAQTHLQAVDMAMYALKKDTSVAVRASAATVLGQLNASQTIPALIEALKDDVSVCRAAARSLGSLKDQRAAMPLFSCLKNAGNDLFLDLADAIGALGESSVIISILKEALQRGKLVPFIGPDLQERLTGVKSRIDFTTQFASSPIDSSRLVSLAKVAAIETNNGRRMNGLVTALKTAYDNHQPPGEFYNHLRHLVVPFWLSACYDNLLASVVRANPIVTGEDAQYYFIDGPKVVQLLGNAGRISGLVVQENEYELLRENENDRKLLVGFLQQELKEKIVLCLGFDPSSPDFALLEKYILNRHLAGVDVRAFLVWQTPAALGAVWNGHPIHLVDVELFDLIKSLSGKENS